MYLRHTTVSKNGKAHTYWRLVRSVRVGGKVRQQTVAQLGELDAQGRVRARALARAIIGVERQPGLFDEPLPAESIAVDLRRFHLERGRRFGDVWLAWRLWQAVGLEDLFEQLLPPQGEAVPWARMAAVLVIARLCAPSSELHIAEEIGCAAPRWPTCSASPRKRSTMIVSTARSIKFCRTRRPWNNT